METGIVLIMPNEDRPEPPMHPSFGAAASWLLIALVIALVVILVRAFIV